jgi:GxxExxY protein
MASLPEPPNAEFAEDSQSSQSSLQNRLSQAVIGCAIEVQRHLGTGLLESAYAAALAIELDRRGLKHEREVPILANYKGVPLGVGFRSDFVVEGKLLLELKAGEGPSEIQRAQVLSYLRLSGLRLGLLINFHEAPLVSRGIARVVNKL